MRTQTVYSSARILLGLIFVIFGLNGFLHFIPLPPPESEAARAFMGGLAGSGYFFPFLKGTEVVFGALLLAGLFVPLSLAVLAPIVLNIVAYHRLAAGGPPLDLLMLGLLALLAYGYRQAFGPMLAARARPSAGEGRDESPRALAAAAGAVRSTR